jgi:hypothetical protein
MAGGEIKLNAGRHTIHVPYFQGPVDAVALQLWVKAPKEDWKLFDLRNFSAPADDSGGNASRAGAARPR